jgi:hypothetical protein
MSAESLNSRSAETKQLLTEICGPDRTTALNSKRTLWRVIRHAGRPGADDERSMLVGELIAALSTDLPVVACRDVLWMLSEIGGDETVEPVARWLTHRELCEDARMVLERIPGDESLVALQVAMDTVSEEFRSNVAQSLRRRGIQLEGYPCHKLVPSKDTRVKAIS